MQKKVKASAKCGILSYGELEKALVGQKKLFPDGIKECGTDALRLTLVSQNIKSKLKLMQLNKKCSLPSTQFFYKKMFKLSYDNHFDWKKVK